MQAERPVDASSVERDPERSSDTEVQSLGSHVERDRLMTADRLRHDAIEAAVLQRSVRIEQSGNADVLSRLNSAVKTRRQSLGKEDTELSLDTSTVGEGIEVITPSQFSGPGGVAGLEQLWGDPSGS